MSNIVDARTHMHHSTRLLMLNAIVYANQLDSQVKNRQLTILSHRINAKGRTTAADLGAVQILSAVLGDVRISG